MLTIAILSNHYNGIKKSKNNPENDLNYK